ncbi:MAG: hypothetical protein OHK0012_20670 [Synechococcales cyanobacterium]
MASRESDSVIHKYALTFDGPGYREKTGFDPSAALEKVKENATFAPLTYEEKRSVLYFLQRDLCKWGLVYENPETSEWWHLYRRLYAHLQELEAS